MNLIELCKEAGIAVPEGTVDRPIQSIQTDSRRVTPGDLFLCIRGLHTDGHLYVSQAVAQGAAALVIEKGTSLPMPRELPVIAVEDPRHAAAMLYDAWYGHPSQKLKVVAVTGTNGKTSVTHMLKAIFEGAMHKCGLVGTVDHYSAGRRLTILSDDPLANMTTPDPAELYHILSVMVEDGVEYVFIEASSHALSLRKLDAICFEAAVFTNLTPEHLDMHGNMENYYTAKKQLFSRCRRAILNRDDAYGQRLAEELDCQVVTCSQGGKADFSAQNIIDCGVEGSEYAFVSRDARFTVRTPIPGGFSVINTLQAGACAMTLGISPAVIMTAIGSLPGVAGRMERVRLGTVTDFSVFIDYAHTPDALENLLRTARGIAGEDQRVVLVFGCGGDRDKTKRPVMGRIAATLADHVIVTSDNSRTEDPMEIICQIAQDMGDADYVIIPDRTRAIEFAVREAHRGDIILLAGKGHEEYEIDREGKHPFHERQIAMRAALRYHGGEISESERT